MLHFYRSLSHILSSTRSYRPHQLNKQGSYRSYRYWFSTWKHSLRAGARVALSPLMETTRSLDWGAQFCQIGTLFNLYKPTKKVCAVCIWHVKHVAAFRKGHIFDSLLFLLVPHFKLDLSNLNIIKILREAKSNKYEWKRGERRWECVCVWEREREREGCWELA